MASKNFRYEHIYSAVKDKTPSASTLYTGEIAVNGNADEPQLFIKDTSGEVRSFYSDYVVNCTQAEYDAMVSAGTVNPRKCYNITDAIDQTIIQGSQKAVAGGAVYPKLAYPSSSVTIEWDSTTKRYQEPISYGDVGINNINKIHVSSCGYLSLYFFCGGVNYGVDYQNGNDLGSELPPNAHVTVTEHQGLAPSGLFCEYDIDLGDSTLDVDGDGYLIYEVLVQTSAGKTWSIGGSITLSNTAKWLIDEFNTSSQAWNIAADQAATAMANLGGLKLKKVTQNEYDTSIKRDDTLYIIVD